MARRKLITSQALARLEFSKRAKVTVMRQFGPKNGLFDVLAIFWI